MLRVTREKRFLIMIPELYIPLPAKNLFAGIFLSRSSRMDWKIMPAHCLPDRLICSEDPAADALAVCDSGSVFQAQNNCVTNHTKGDQE